MKRPQSSLQVAVGSQLRRMRLKQDASQMSFAVSADIFQSHVNQIESGKRSISLDTFIRICAALQIKPSDFLREIGL